MKKNIFRRIASAVLAGTMVFSIAACGNKQEETKASETVVSSEKSDEGSGAYAFEGKIGLMVGTVAISQEEDRTAKAWQDLLGEDKIVIANYPDNFMSEEETTISNLVNLVSDPEIKVVIINQGIPGSAAAIAKAKESRPDVLYIVGGPNEDPDVITAQADLVLDSDFSQLGTSVAERAKEMGAENIVYYSFPRHQGYQKIAYCRAQMEKKCQELGIHFEYVVMPDPQSDAGTTGTQQFVIEDVPKELEKYGPNTGFFDTNTMSTPAVIKAVYDAGKGIYMNPSQQSPFDGYPDALGISVPEDKTNNYEWMIEAIQNKLKETGDNGRFSTRTIPVTILTINTAVEYGIRYLQGATNGEKLDINIVEEAFKKATGDAAGTTFRVYDVEGVTYDNEVLVQSPWSLL